MALLALVIVIFQFNQTVFIERGDPGAQRTQVAAERPADKNGKKQRQSKQSYQGNADRRLMMKQPGPEVAHQWDTLPDSGSLKYNKHNDKGKEVSEVSQSPIHYLWKRELLHRNFEEKILRCASRAEKSAESPAHAEIPTQNTVKEPGADNAEGAEYRTGVTHNER